MNQNLADALQQLLADTYSLYLKTQNYHWNVAGKQFYSLHSLFEEQYGGYAAAIDEIAEQIRKLGFSVSASLSLFASASTLKEPLINANAEDMLNDLLADNQALIASCQKILALSDEKTTSTADLLAARIAEHEKNAWFIKSSLS